MWPCLLVALGVPFGLPLGHLVFPPSERAATRAGQLERLGILAQGDEFVAARCAKAVTGAQIPAP